jgi:predicted nuclease of predicted toxin-antitoxin system
MLISKHHYAIELAKKGNEVYFINPISNNHFNVLIEAHPEYENLFIVNSGFYFIEQFRFRFNIGFYLITKINNERIKKKINKKIDVIWNFDFLGYCHFSSFKKALKIAHPVDFTKKKYLKYAKGADVVFSVANEIIEEFSFLKVPSFFINHGISEEFIQEFNHSKINKNSLKVGYIGNLLRHDIDYNILHILIQNHPEINFIFYGNYKPSNIGGSLTKETSSFINELKNSANVTLKGVYSPIKLSNELNKIDIFLIAYNQEKDFCKGTNYHKVIEYLSTGKVIISNHITTYSKTNLIEMPIDKQHPEEFISIFSNVIENIEYYNSTEKQQQRINFAKNNTYPKQIERIENLINQVLK